jgi:integrase
LALAAIVPSLFAEFNMKENLSQSKRHPKLAHLHIFKAPNGKSRNWYGGFHHKGKFLSKSTGTRVYEHALAVAEEWFWNMQISIKSGAVKVGKGPSFREFAKQLPSEMRALQASPAYIKSVQIILADGGYVDRFFGDLEVSAIESRTWDRFRTWLTDTRIKEGKPPFAERSMHQKKNAVRLVMKQAYRRQAIPGYPRFFDTDRPKKRDARPRVYFNHEEYRRVLKAASERIMEHRRKRTRWVADAEELRDFIVFMANTGLRVGEAKALRVCDVRVERAKVQIKGKVESADVCRLTITAGKRGAHHDAVSYMGAPHAFRRICRRRGIAEPSACQEPLFLKHHHEAFKRLLKDIGLYRDQHGRKRDFVSLRHSYICHRLENGVSAYDVATNTRTSVVMIENHYAKALSALSQRLNVVA